MNIRSGNIELADTYVIFNLFSLCFRKNGYLLNILCETNWESRNVPWIPVKGSFS